MNENNNYLSCNLNIFSEMTQAIRDMDRGNCNNNLFKCEKSQFCRNSVDTSEANG